jgi:hypothetical protein
LGARKISKLVPYNPSFVSIILKECGDPVARQRRTGLSQDESHPVALQASPIQRGIHLPAVNMPSLPSPTLTDTTLAPSSQNEHTDDNWTMGEFATPDAGDFWTRNILAPYAAQTPSHQEQPDILDPLSFYLQKLSSAWRQEATSTLTEAANLRAKRFFRPETETSSIVDAKEPATGCNCPTASDMAPNSKEDSRFSPEFLRDLADLQRSIDRVDEMLRAREEGREGVGVDSTKTEITYPSIYDARPDSNLSTGHEPAETQGPLELSGQADQKAVSPADQTATIINESGRDADSLESPEASAPTASGLRVLTPANAPTTYGSHAAAESTNIELSNSRAETERIQNGPLNMAPCMGHLENSPTDQRRLGATMHSHHASEAPYMSTTNLVGLNRIVAPENLNSTTETEPSTGSASCQCARAPPVSQLNKFVETTPLAKEMLEACPASEAEQQPENDSPLGMLVWLGIGAVGGALLSVGFYLANRKLREAEGRRLELLPIGQPQQNIF